MYVGAYEFKYLFSFGEYTDLVTDEVPISGTEYNAVGIILSSGTVYDQSGGAILFEAGMGIEFNANFEARLGKVFEVRIEYPCVD